MVERHAVEVAPDLTVPAVHHPADTDAWLVCCHGFRSDKSGSYEGRCERAVAEGYNAVRFDFRGCGEADGAFADGTLDGRLADLRAVVDHFDPPTYALFGSSFGGTVALHAAAADDRVWAVGTRAPVTLTRAFDAYREAIEREGRLEFEPGVAIDERFVEALDAHPFADVAEGLDCPVAMIHGAEDATVPVEDTFEAASRLSGDVLVEQVAGEGHRFSRAAEARLRDRLFDWLATR